MDSGGIEKWSHLSKSFARLLCMHMVKAKYISQLQCRYAPYSAVVDTPGPFRRYINFVIGITDSLWKQTIMLTNLKTSSSLRLRVLFFLHRKFYLYVQWLEFFAINIVGLILIRGSFTMKVPLMHPKMFDNPKIKYIEDWQKIKSRHMAI